MFNVQVIMSQSVERSMESFREMLNCSRWDDSLSMVCFINILSSFLELDMFSDIWEILIDKSSISNIVKIFYRNAHSLNWLKPHYWVWLVQCTCPHMSRILKSDASYQRDTLIKYEQNILGLSLNLISEVTDILEIHI